MHFCTSSAEASTKGRTEFNKKQTGWIYGFTSILVGNCHRAVEVAFSALLRADSNNEAVW